MPATLSLPQAAARLAPAVAAANGLRQDLRLIADMIEPQARVLDIGCGDGALLAYLARQKRVDGRGIELSQSGVNSCVGHGLSVIQGDADQIVPIDDSGRLSAKLVKNGTLKVIAGAPHGLCTTHADVVNQELLAFLQNQSLARSA